MSVLSSITKYRLTYRNWLHVARFVKSGRTPIRATLRKDGTMMTFHSTVTAYLVASGYDVEDEMEGDAVVLKFAWTGRRLELRINDRNWGGVEGTFFHDDYRFIASPNKVVLDVGANVGDSALYFAWEGAKKVIAVEPFPAAFNLLLINVAKGGFPSVIEPVNAAVGKPFGSIILNPTATGIGQVAAAGTVGVAIPTVSLSQLTKTYGIEDGMLKMDCEGAEYDVIGNSDVAILRSFAKMQIEYHHGYAPRGASEKGSVLCLALSACSDTQSRKWHNDDLGFHLR